MKNKISEGQRRFEILAVIATGLGKFVFVDCLEQKTIYIFGAILFWLAYVIYRHRENPEILSYWGFTRKNFMQTWRPLAIAGLVVVIAFVLYAVSKDQFHLHWHLFAILLLYPIWGIIQQFLMMSLIGGNLKDSNKNNFSDFAIIAITSLSFSLTHLPVELLVIATFALALVYSFLFLKYRNLWPLGIFHGWLGAMFYYFVLNRDPWVEVFGGG